MNKSTTGIKFLSERINPIWNILAILAILLLVGFSNSNAQIILTSSTTNTITISWTAPGDDDYTGTASSYDIRYSESTINDANWGAASQANNEPSPQIAGSDETFEISGLTENTTYYIRIKTADEVPNWSGLSNEIIATTKSVVVDPLDPPQTAGEVIDSINGIAILSCSTITSANLIVYQFALDTNSSFPTPVYQTGSVSGNIASATFTGLDSLNIYFWHCRAIDTITNDTSNWSSPTNTFNFNSKNNIDTPEEGAIAVDSINGIATLSCYTVASENLLVYRFALDTTSYFLTPVYQTGSVSGNVALSTFTGLDNLNDYFWHCRAIDTITNDTSDWSTTRTFNFNSPPSTPENILPEDGDTVTSVPLTLVVSNSTDIDGDPLTYYFDLSTDSLFNTIVTSLNNVTEGDSQTTAVLDSFSPVNGQTYWWRCRSYDSRLFSNYSTTTSFTYVDLNAGNECLTPPEIALLQSPANGTEISSESPQLCVINSTPAPGCTDPQVYTFELYTDELMNNLVTTYNDLPEGTGTTCANITETLQSGSFYFWRVKCSNGSAESDWAGPFYFHTQNSLPPTPGLVSPDNEDTVTSLTPTLSITRVNDPDGTKITYEFEISISSDFSSLASAGQVEDTTSIINWVVSDPLTNNSFYHWRARTTDGIGYSQYSVTRKFYVESSSQNTPTAPQVHSPSDGSTVGSQNPHLTVINGIDNEGDSLTYDFQVFDQSGVTQIAVGFGIPEDTTTTEWIVTTQLTDGLSYQWRARCSDGTYYSNWTTMTEFSVDLEVAINNPPTVPNHILPLNGETITGMPITLTIENSVDPENDIVTYDFFISDDPSFSQDIALMLDVSETAIETSVEFNLNLADGERYYWRVRAKDGENVTAFSSATYFDYIDLSVNEDDYTAGIGGAFDGSTILTTTPTLAASNISIVETKNYYFEVATDSFMYNIVTLSDGVPEKEGGQTNWQVEEELESGQDYYWRVKVNDYPYSQVAKIHIQFAAYAHPNPIHLGGNVTFVLPPEEVDLLIQTISGETVLIQENVSNEWIWNLKNSAGSQVAVGIYLWYIAGSNVHGKIMVKP